MTYLFRLSRIGDNLPVDHYYPTLNENGDGVELIRRNGAQCFSDLAELVQHIGDSAMVPGADRVLMIEVEDGRLPHDESGWAIITDADVIAVRRLPADADYLYSLDDDELFAAGEPVEATFVKTLA